MPTPFDSVDREFYIARATRYIYDENNYDGCDDFDEIVSMLQACLEGLGRTKAEARGRYECWCGSRSAIKDAPCTCVNSDGEDGIHSIDTNLEEEA